MIELFRWALVTLGLVYLVTEASIFTVPRAFLASKSHFLGALVYCPACSGYWVGFLVGILGFWPFETIGIWALSIMWLESAIAACALGALWGKLHPNPAVFAEAPFRAQYGTDFYAEVNNDDQKGASEDG